MNGAAAALGGITALVIGLAAIDDRIGTEMGRFVEGHGPSDEIVRLFAKLQHTVVTAAQSLSYHSIEQAPLTIFGLAALVLLLFMLRT
jgi:hypothetical protein